MSTYNAPPRRNPQRLPLLIRRAQILQRIESEGDMQQAAAIVVLVRRSRDIQEGDPVVLVIVGNEGEVFVSVN